MPSRSHRRRRMRKMRQHNQVASIIPPSETLHTEMSLLLRNFEGDGSFGLVTLGTLRKPDGSLIKVALKGANKSEYIKMMKAEAKIMANFDHVNVVKLFGVQKTPFKIIMEYMQHGDLLDALRKNVFSNGKDLIEILIQVASGMEYISEMNFIHRDLACRNVFVNAKKQCKIGDFGLSTYVGNTGGVFKMKKNQFFNNYCAPEVMNTSEFTTKCDVWSMGLLTWELYVSAAKEAPGFYKQILLDLFIISRQLAKPKLCPPSLFAYVKNVLLNVDPSKRPTFSEVKKFLCCMRDNMLLRYVS